MKEIHFLFMRSTFFKSKSIKLYLYNIQNHLVKIQIFCMQKLNSLHFCNNRAMSSQKMPSRGLKVKAKEAEPKFRTYCPMQRCCSISVGVWHVLEVKEVRRGFPPPHFSSQWCEKPMKKCCYTWGTQELSQALWYSIQRVFRHFYCLEWIQSRKGIWMR